MNLGKKNWGERNQKLGIVRGRDEGSQSMVNNNGDEKIKSKTKLWMNLRERKIV